MLGLEDGSMTLHRRRLGLAAFLGLVWIGLLAQPVAALHDGAIADCGDAGTFTINAQPNGAGFESPKGSDVLLFEEGATFIIYRIVVDGVVTFDVAQVGQAHNALDEVTCTYTLRNGVEIEETGLLLRA
jgi:hypothetical protein